MMKLFFWLMIALGVSAQPRPVLDVFQAASEALANQDAKAFLDQFDDKMPGYAKLRDQVQEMVAIDESASTVDVVTDDGDDNKRTLSLDWVLTIGSERPRRQIVKCTVEKQGKKWKITALDPIEFFKK